METNSKIDNLILTDSQQRALEKIIEFIESSAGKVFILKGYAGTGKTTLVSAILGELGKKRLPYSLLASTGRAAKVLSNKLYNMGSGEKSQGLTTKTVHSEIYEFADINQDMDLFGQPSDEVPEKDRKAVKLEFVLSKKALFCHNMVYIIDEASMISDSKPKTMSQAEYGTDGRLLQDLLAYDRSGKFIFIGDACQLPPINASFSPALSADYFSERFGINAEEAELTEIVRQASGNDISVAAARIRKLSLSPGYGNIAKFPFRGYNNIHILKNEYELLNEYIKSISDLYYSRATMIAMSNKTVNSLSNIIRPALGFRSRTVSVGDLLLVSQNNLISGLMNGDLLKVVQVGQREYRACLTFVHVEVQSLDTNQVYSQLMIEDILCSGLTNITQEQQTGLYVDFHIRMKALDIKQESKEYKENMFRDPYLNALRCVFGYALTCHKSQGGEWDKVFLVIPRGLPYNDPRSYAYQWVYTAMTRARKELYVINDYWIC